MVDQSWPQRSCVHECVLGGWMYHVGQPQWAQTDRIFDTQDSSCGHTSIQVLMCLLSDSDKDQDHQGFCSILNHKSLGILDRYPSIWEVLMENVSDVHLKNSEIPHLLPQTGRKFPRLEWPLEVCYLVREGEVEESPHTYTSDCRKSVYSMDSSSCCTVWMKCKWNWEG